MPKIALNLICKNESHIVARLLESVKPIVDLIVAVDTGSEDNTISLINRFGQENSIPTFVFERPFDNFRNSRNYAIDRLINVANQLQWDIQRTWGLCIDCDEMLVMSDKFSKEQISKDLYDILTRDGEIAFMRRSLFRLSTNCRWERPVHEVIVWQDPSATVGVLDHVCVQCEPKGASWKGNVEKKSLNYARLLREYIDEGHTDFKTLYDTGRSYEGAAENCKSTKRAKAHRLTAMKYYEMAVEIKDLPSEDKISIYRNLASTKRAIGGEWDDAQDLLLNSYALDMIKGESIADIIDYYMQKKRWNTAYLFSYFGEKCYNGNDPSGRVSGVITSSLYQWRFLLRNIVCAYMSGNRVKARLSRKKLRDYLLTHYESFTVRELMQIQSATLASLFFKFWLRKLFFRASSVSKKD